VKIERSGKVKPKRLNPTKSISALPTFIEGSSNILCDEMFFCQPQYILKIYKKRKLNKNNRRQNILTAKTSDLLMW